jgi:hypothetical protein
MNKRNDNESYILGELFFMIKYKLIDKQIICEVVEDVLELLQKEGKIKNEEIKK